MVQYYACYLSIVCVSERAFQAFKISRVIYWICVERESRAPYLLVERIVIYKFVASGLRLYLKTRLHDAVLFCSELPAALSLASE